MSRLEELIQELCPDGVEYKKIGTVIDYEQPSKYIVKSTDYNDDFDLPVLTAGQSFILGYTNEKDGIYTASKNNPVIIFDDFTGAFKWVDFPFKVKSSAMKMLKANEDMVRLRFIFHMMGVINFISDEHKRLWISTYSEFKIPVPPLPVQEEIVRILDNFTELTTELTTELEARKKQYEYYRDQLLESPRGEVIETTMGNVLTFLNGRAYKQEELLGAGKYPVLRVGNFYTNSSWYYSDLELEESKYCENGDLLYSWAATLGPKIWDGGKCIFHYHIWKILFDEEVIDKQYLYYYLQYDLSQIAKSTTKSTMIHVSMGSMKGRPIRLPHISEQKRIAQLIRRFDVLSSDMKMGLPAEIEARKKQYEFYRDKLLSFKEAGK